MKRAVARVGEKNGDNRGQMTVELCIVIPAAITIAVIVVNAVSFFGYCAEFDRVARNAVRVVAASPSAGATRDTNLAIIRSCLEDSFDEGNLSCSVTSHSDHDGFETYEATLQYRPTLFGLGLRGSIFGVALPHLHHVSSLTVDPYKPGEFF